MDKKLENRLKNIEKMVKDIRDITLIPYETAFKRGQKNRKRLIKRPRKKSL